MKQINCRGVEWIKQAIVRTGAIIQLCTIYHIDCEDDENGRKMNEEWARACRSIITKDFQVLDT